ncbi:UME6 C6 zinc finger URS1-binding protein-like protein [Scheffersomyces coipomensis]|uniref:UME6 C6 zinc finger URS1-binding protein-like protein n=1 Tax=Scheffersomyces coipomensis TaxID=1788519 RepID=UPI00315C5473
MKNSTDTPSSATYDNEDTIRLNSSMITSSPIMGNSKYDHQVVQYQQQLQHQNLNQNQQLLLLQQQQQQQIQFHGHYQQPQPHVDLQRLAQFETNDQDLYQFENLGQFNPLPPPPISRNKAPSISSTFSGGSNSYDLSPTAGISNPIISTNHHDNAASQILQQNDEDFQSNAPHYSFFSHQNGVNSNNSLPLQNNSHNTHNNFQNNNNSNTNSALFKLNMESTPDLLSQNMSLNQSELMYNLTEFDVVNPSLDSIPDSMIYSHQNTSLNSISNHHNNNNNSNMINNNNILGNLNESNAISYSISATNEISQFPYTPTLSDVYTPTLSDSSFTPNSTVNTNYPLQGSFEDQSLRAPTPHYSSSNTTNKISKKPSLSRLNNSMVNNKKNLIIQTHLASSTSNLSSSTPLSESSPKVSPLSNKYKGLENNHNSGNHYQNSSTTRSLSNYSTSSTTSTNTNSASAYPPLNVFRHNSDASSTASTKNSEINVTTSNITVSTPVKALSTPRRKTYPSLNEISLKKSNKNLRKIPSRDSVIMQDGSKNSSRDSFTSHSSEDGINDTPTGKAKKYTRRRLLPRSKNGCWICRIKHLKCDEVRPHCASCLKFGIECDYSKDKPDYVIDKQLRLQKLDELSLIRKQNQVATKNQKNKLKAGFNDQFQNFATPSPHPSSKSQYFS